MLDGAQLFAMNAGSMGGGGASHQQLGGVLTALLPIGTSPLAALWQPAGVCNPNNWKLHNFAESKIRGVFDVGNTFKGVKFVPGLEDGTAGVGGSVHNSGGMEIQSVSADAMSAGLTPTPISVASAGSSASHEMA